MKREHKVNWGWTPPPDPVDAAYQREVDRATNRGERDYRRAQEGLERAQRRLERLERMAAEEKLRTAERRRLERLRAEVEDRRLELRRLHKLMGVDPGRGHEKHPVRAVPRSEPL